MRTGPCATTCGDLMLRTLRVLAAALVVIVLVALLLDATSQFDGEQQQAQEFGQAEPVTTGWVRVNRPVDLSSLNALPSVPSTAGAEPGLIPDEDGPVLVNLWASWCGPCEEELPWLGRLARGGRPAGEELDVVGVSRDSFAEYATESLELAGADYPNVLDTDARFSEPLSDVLPNALPLSFIVEDGQMTWVHVGPFDSYQDLSCSVRGRTATR